MARALQSQLSLRSYELSGYRKMAEIPVLEAAPGQEPAPPRKSSWLLISALLLLLLGGGGAGAWFYLMGGETSEVGENAPDPKLPPIYVALDPPFVVNFENEGMVRFLQVSVQLMSRDQATVDLLKANDPVVRNDLLLLLANQSYAVLSSREGKEALRKQALESVRRVLLEAGGKPDLLEAVYFTSFVMQ